YADLDNDGQIETPEEILWEGHYYPFGMEMKGPWMDQPTQETNYKYNGIEKEEHHGLNINIATYRVLDPAVGQWCSVDPKAEVLGDMSPYQAMANNPISFNDPDGDVIHIVIGAAIGGVGNLVYQGLSGNIQSVGDGFAAFGIGAGAGALGAATGGASLAAMGAAGTLTASIGYGAAAGAIGGATAGFVQETGNALVFQNSNFGDALGTGAKGAAWGAVGGAVFGGVAGGFSYAPNSSPPLTGGSSLGDDINLINGKNISLEGVETQFPDILDESGKVIHRGGVYSTKFAPKISNSGPLLPGGYGVPNYYTYMGKVFVHPHAFKHLQELGKKSPLAYRKLIGEKFQESLHSAIDDVLSRPGPLKFDQPYRSGGNRIIFGKPGKTGPLPVVKHFSSYK
ncbi:MAG TPA: RHS repeat-associated core domain-containing protein, partial [Saprospiraceae bacterium]|nr:RHS repeat-associated core domain-containing protein [Saprospiraceae bacterium]